MDQNNLDHFDLSSKATYSTYISISAAKGLQDVMKKNLGPKGAFKILVSGSGDIKITKSGNLLLKEMQIQNPIALLIAKTIYAQNFFCGDGTTSIILLLGELFRNIENYIEKNIHPQVLCEGINVAKKELESWLDSQIIIPKKKKQNLIKLAKSIFKTKIKNSHLDNISRIVVDAVLTIQRQKEISDINLIEILQMEDQNDSESRFVRGIVLDHGARHPDMPKILHNVFILVCNISLEYEKSEINSNFISTSYEKKGKLSNKERDIIDKKINKIIQLKRLVCKGGNKSFLIVNQKGIDNISLDLLCREGILGLRRTKKKNMERISILCNAIPINSSDDIDSTVLGFAGIVYEKTIGEEKFTFIENVSNPFSGTILVKGMNAFLRKNTEEIIRDGIKSIKLCFEDKGYLLGGGITELNGSTHLSFYADKIHGEKKFGVLALSKSLLVIPETLNENEGKNFLKNRKMQNEKEKFNIHKKEETFYPNKETIFDCFSSKKQVFNSVCSIATQILQIDEILLGKGLNN
mmetsp:Transcript_4882/g.12480  ORF Transcript_4882/g.12480 Transcript_4882/m.12480 type:complete len:523 (-) Transcript_4882:264-1832(-)